MFVRKGLTKKSDEELTKTPKELLIDFLEKKSFTSCVDSLRNNNTILELTYRNIGDEGAKVLAEELKNNTVLTRLILYHNEIKTEGAKAIGEALKINKALKFLELRDNQIGDEGAKAIGEALKSNSTLRYLNLYSSQIGDEGAKIIGEALKSNSILRNVILSDNQIGDEGAKVFGEVLKGNSTLQYLDLGIGRIGIEGEQYLIEPLKNNTSIIGLNFSYRIEDERAKIIKEYLQRNKNLAFDKVFLAIRENRLQDAENLAKGHGLPIREVDNKGNTLLHYAAEKGMESVCDIFISKLYLGDPDNPPNVFDVTNEKKETILISAVIGGLPKICELLILWMDSRQISRATDTNETALTLAASKGLEKVCELLIPKMTEQAINQVTNNGNTALSLAQQKGFKNICDLLELKINKESSIITFIVKEIIYDKSLLNHPELLGAAMEKFSLKEIGERIDELSPRLIDVAINSEDGELIILGGLMSLDNSAAPGS
ncbi:MULTISPECIES: ankyrin repeat domain-containing protein [unclassified Rickettsia]|uniref:ankyrin repeat domain-containing protein n=1 Tax=unclassified Rickettsia TaxID=114295 RepID=UPI00313317F9